MRGLDELAVAVEAVGAPAWQPPAGTEALDELEAAIAPMQLPDDVRKWWRTVDADRFPVLTYPQFHGPGFALTTWREEPFALLSVAYESHVHMCVELGIEDDPGGALFEYGFGFERFKREFNSLSGWLIEIATRIEAGQFGRLDDGRLAVPAPEDETGSWPPPPPHPEHGDRVFIDFEFSNWPGSWQRAYELDPATTAPRGATHTIHEVLGSPIDLPLRATVAAEVVTMWPGLAGTGTRAHIDDGTGTLDVVFETDARRLPTLRGRFEFDLVLEPGERHAPADEKTAGLAAAAALEARWSRPPSAVAKAVRPL